MDLLSQRYIAVISKESSRVFENHTLGLIYRADPNSLYIDRGLIGESGTKVCSLYVIRRSFLFKLH